MKKEEIFLFPSIKKLAAIYKNTESDWTQIQSIRELTQPIKQMEAEHDEAGIYIKQLIDLTNNFTVPENACLTFSVFYVKLKEFCDDLMMHIHLENNILFPRAIKLAAKFENK